LRQAQGRVFQAVDWPSSDNHRRLEWSPD
jgi:hypothetical protein